MEPIDNAEAAEGHKSTGSSYSPDGKLKRYNGILQEFMAYYLGREQYPNHSYSEAELSSIQPHDIVNWMNVKAFGTEEPDFRDPSVSGSHHTLAFWRKGLGYYMPAGQIDWDPVNKTGNPSRSQEVRDLISMVKALNDDGTLLPRKQPNNAKREGEDGGGGRKKRARRPNPTPRVGPGAPQNAPTPIVMSAEFNDLLRQIHAQKTGFLQSLEQLNTAVNKMKSDVESSYTVMIGQLASLGSRATVASSGAAEVPGVPTIPAPLIARSRTLFTVWSVQGGKLSPVPADWSFPKALTAKEAIYMWFNGEPSSHTPPLQYLTTGHLKHLKGAAASHGGVRRFMKLVRYLGLKNHFWLENWDKARVSALWSKIWPEMELAVGDHLSEDADDGSIKCGTLLNTISKNSNLMKEVAENLQIQTEAYAAEMIAATEEALGVNVGVGSENASKEMMWGIHHGKLNPFPSDWQFPTNVDAATVLGLWLLGDPDTGIPPLRYVHSTYVSFLKCGAGYISKLRCVMKVVKHQAVQLGCWSEDNWSEDTVAALWAQVWGAINPKLKHQTATSTVSWQALYNKMHESGMIKELSTNKAGDNEEEQDLDEGQPTDV